MRALVRALGAGLQRAVPSALKAHVPVSLRARARALLGLEPWPDLAVRHPLFRSHRYREMRRAAAPFDAAKKSYKPVVHRGHQTSFLTADWFARASVRSVFHVGYASGRYLFYFLRSGIDGGGTDLSPDEAPTVEVPLDLFPAAARVRLARGDFFELTPARVREIWGDPGAFPLDVLFTEATLETLIPWRTRGFTNPKYAGVPPEVRQSILYRELPGRLAELQPCFRNMVFIEPEPMAGGAGQVFHACATGLPGFEYSVWRFRAPFDQLFRLSPSQPTKQVVYAYTRDPMLLTVLGEYAERA
jgi:hypothetical protein